MNLLEENIVPGKQGKVFDTNAKSTYNLERIKAEILKVKGVKNVVVNFEKFPSELTIHTSKLIALEEIEEKTMAVGFHITPKVILKAKLLEAFQDPIKSIN